jgi:hypothetical protein
MDTLKEPAPQNVVKLNPKTNFLNFSLLTCGRKGAGNIKYTQII